MEVGQGHRRQPCLFKKRHIYVYMKDLIRKILKESSDWDWVDDVPDGFRLEPKVIYYTEPPLNPDEAIFFFNSITNPPRRIEHIKDSITKHNRSLSYIVIDDTISSSWNDEGGVEKAISMGNKLYSIDRSGYDTMDIGPLFRE